MSSTVSVYKVDLATLAVTATYPMPSGSCPESLAAVTERYIAVGTTCDEQWGAVGVLDVTTGSFNATAGYDPYYQPMVRTVPNSSQVLVVDTHLSGSSAGLYDVSSGAPVQSRKSLSLADCENLGDLAMSPDAQSFALACGAPYRQLEYSLADFSELASYPTNPYPTAVAFTTDGSLLAAGMDGLYKNDVALFHHTSNDHSQVSAQDLTNASTAYPTTVVHGLAFGPGETTLYDVAADPTTSQVWLYSLAGSPTVIPRPGSTVALAAPASTAVGQPVTVTGSLRFSDTTTVSAVAGRPITVTNSVTGTTTVRTDATGAFSISLTPSSTGTLTVSASYAGDALHTGASASTGTAVVLRTTTLSVLRRASATHCLSPPTSAPPTPTAW